MTSQLDQADDQPTPDSRAQLKDVLSGLQATSAGEMLSVSELIQMKLKQITCGNIDTVESHGSTEAFPDTNDIQSAHHRGFSNVSSGELSVCA